MIEPVLWIDAVEFCCFDQRVGDGRRVSAALGTHEEVVFPAERDGSPIVDTSSRYDAGTFAEIDSLKQGGFPGRLHQNNDRGLFGRRVSGRPPHATTGSQ